MDVIGLSAFNVTAVCMHVSSKIPEERVEQREQTLTAASEDEPHLTYEDVTSEDVPQPRPQYLVTLSTDAEEPTTTTMTARDDQWTSLYLQILSTAGYKLDLQ